MYVIKTDASGILGVYLTKGEQIIAVDQSEVANLAEKLIDFSAKVANIPEIGQNMSKRQMKKLRARTRDVKDKIDIVNTFVGNPDEDDILLGIEKPHTNTTIRVVTSRKETRLSEEERHWIDELDRGVSVNLLAARIKAKHKLDSITNALRLISDAVAVREAEEEGLVGLT